MDVAEHPYFVSQSHCSNCLNQPPVMPEPFEALVIRREGGVIHSGIEDLLISDLPSHGEIIVRIPYSSLNFKDALAVTGEGKVVKGEYPFVPGIDLVGEVVETASDRFTEGDWVIGTGGGLGEAHWGGFSGMQRVAHNWLVGLPPGLSTKHSMIIGTAGLTAMLAIIQMEKLGQSPDQGPIVVTGATGGVGSFSVLLLAKLGFTVTASTGKPQAEEYLTTLGATSVVNRSVLSRGAGRELDSARWGGAIDTVGGSTLEAIVSQTGRHGCIAVCGLVGHERLNTTVYPLILRGINLLGIDSNTCPVSMRKVAWTRLVELLNPDLLESLADSVPLSAVAGRSRDMLAGHLKGRTLVEHNA